MKFRLFVILILILLSVGSSWGQELWKKQGIKLPAPVCYASHEVHQSFIKPGIQNDLLKSGNLKKATIEVTYIGFSPEAQTAFEYAVELWRNLIYSPVPIRIRASMLSLNKSVLGSSSPADYYKNFNSTQIWNCYYPVALVEKMLGEQINSKDDYEIVASFNKDLSDWYFGTDGKTPPNQYDFVSTVMHELAHGLGYSGFFYTDRGRGGYGDDGLSAAFDQYVENKSGQRLVNSSLFTNPSIALYQNLTSGWLEFDTRLLSGPMPRLYAPSVWDSGSSIYHLNESTFPAGDQNSLMTPFSGTGEAVHDPGPNTLAMLFELGWKTLTIKHEELKDKEFVSTPIDIVAQIESDYDLDSAKTYLYYTTGKFSKTDSVLLAAGTVPLEFKAQLPKTLSGEVRYYFSATDKQKRTFKFPSGAPTRYLSFKIGPDTELPVLKHEPVKYMLTTSLSEKINVEVTDNMGVKSVKVEYFVNGGTIQNLALAKDTGDIYSGNLAFTNVSLKDGDKVSYRIVATDISSNANIGRSPATGFNTFYVEGIQAPVSRYVNNFNTATRDFISSDFVISTVSGFDSPALNTAHPYPSPDTDNMEFNFTSLLKYPIILKSGGKMTFDEIVLVEPGETGTKFGDEEFWDYVIIEGSKDGGKLWKPLLDGYDSGAQKTWFNLFNSAMSGQNSTAVPTKDLFVKREIDLLANGNFKAGDTIQVRFRLFSDPYSHGWGWVIDNLSIQDIGTETSPVLLSSGEVNFYPNPATERVSIDIQSAQKINHFNLKVYNSVGEMLFNQFYPVRSTRFATTIDVRGFRPGLYLFALEQENGRAITRKLLIQ